MKQHRNPLGHDPLSAGIFTKTQVDEQPESLGEELVTINHKPDSGNQKTETINHKPESGNQELDAGTQSVTEEIQGSGTIIQNLAESPRHPESVNHKPDSGLLLDGPKEKITLQFPTYLNEWLDDLIRSGKRRHGQKIQKQVWFQAAFELMKSLPVDWEDVNSTDKLKEELEFWITQLASFSNQTHKP